MAKLWWLVAGGAVAAVLVALLLFLPQSDNGARVASESSRSNSNAQGEITQDAQPDEGQEEQTAPASDAQTDSSTGEMRITSAAFSHNSEIPVKYTCDGDNVNPPLEFLDVPEQARSLVLIVDDPDAPTGTWTHWIVFNISPETSSIAENSVPAEAKLGKNSWGENSYGGPCPPSGTHRYFFKLYALDSELSLNQGVTKQEIEQAMQGKIIASTELVGLYSRAS